MAPTAVQDIAMPRLSDSMEEGTVLNWLKQVGDEVAVGEELVEIETDKANMGYEADVAGTLLEIVVGENVDEIAARLVERLAPVLVRAAGRGDDQAAILTLDPAQEPGLGGAAGVVADDDLRARPGPGTSLQDTGAGREAVAVRGDDDGQPDHRFVSRPSEGGRAQPRIRCSILAQQAENAPPARL